MPCTHLKLPKIKRFFRPLPSPTIIPNKGFYTLGCAQTVDSGSQPKAGVGMLGKGGWFCSPRPQNPARTRLQTRGTAPGPHTPLGVVS